MVSDLAFAYYRLLDVVQDRFATGGSGVPSIEKSWLGFIATELHGNCQDDGVCQINGLEFVVMNNGWVFRVLQRTEV